jgi:hypothetical protein
MEELAFLSKYNPFDFVFSPKCEPSNWDATNDNRRDYFTNKFKEVKDLFTKKTKDGDKEYFALGSEYGIYSFRHTFFTKIYREMRKTLTPFETKSRLMLITVHNTMMALEKYLRDIDAELPDDYSDLIN